MMLSVLGVEWMKISSLMIKHKVWVGCNRIMIDIYIYDVECFRRGCNILSDDYPVLLYDYTKIKRSCAIKSCNSIN